MMSVLRHVEVKDYDPIIQVIDEWWGGPPWQGCSTGSFLSIFSPPAL